jgi:hypothetical protein
VQRVRIGIGAHCQGQVHRAGVQPGLALASVRSACSSLRPSAVIA